MKFLKEYFSIAANGKELWKKIRNKFSYKEGNLLLILPKENNKMNNVAIEYLPVYMKKKYISKTLVICNYEDYVAENEIENVLYVQLSNEQINEIVKYYSLVTFEKNIILIMDEQPFASVGIINKKGITIEDYVKDTFFEQVMK